MVGGVKHEDCFEKADLAQRLAEARLRLGEAKPPPPPPPGASEAARPPPGASSPAAPRRAGRPILELPMRRLRSTQGSPKEYILIPLTLGGRGPFDFLLDTGSSTTLVTPDLAYRQLGLPPGSGQVSRGLGGMGAASQGREVALPEAALGSHSCGALRAVVMDLGYAGLDATVGGIVGLNLLSLFDVEFDFAAASIAFHGRGSAASGAIDLSGLVRLAPANFPFAIPGVQASVEGGPPVPALLDLGSAISVCPWSTARAAGITPGSKGVIPGAMAGVAIGGKQATMAAGKLDVTLRGASGRSQDVAYPKVAVVLGDLAALDAFGAGLLLGISLFQGSRLVISFLSNTVYIGPGRQSRS